MIYAHFYAHSTNLTFRDKSVHEMLAAVEMSAFDGINEQEFEVMWKNKKEQDASTSRLNPWASGVTNILAGI